MKEQNSKRVHVCMSESLYASAVKCAEHDGITVSEYLRGLIQEDIEYLKFKDPSLFEE